MAKVFQSLPLVLGWTVPHDSIRRMLALGDDCKMDSHSPKRGVMLDLKGHRTHFPAFIEATGQYPLGIGDFPFPSLRAKGVVTDAAQGNPDRDARGIAVDEVFHPIAEGIATDRLFCLSLPFHLGRHPSIQRIASSYEWGEIVGRELAGALDRHAVNAPLSATDKATE